MVKKSFSIELEVKDFPNISSEVYQKSLHFVITWVLTIMKYGGDACVSLDAKYDPKQSWSIDLDYKFLLKSEPKPKRNWNWKFMEDKRWEESYNWEDILKKDMTADNCVTFVCQVQIKKMSGIAPKRIIDFDKPIDKSPDMIVLKVGEQKFHVLNSLLRFRSPYFNTLFHGPFVESTQSEVELKEVDPDDFQGFLEVIYAEPEAIQMENVEGVLKLADQFDVAVVRQQCEKFLAETFGVCMELKLQLAYEYSLEKLKMKCFNLLSDEANQTPSELAGLSYSEVLELYEKSLERYITSTK